MDRNICRHKIEFLWLFLWTIVCLTGLSYCKPDKPEGSTDIPSIYYTEPSTPENNDATELNELPGGHIISGQRIFKRSSSPYILREDLFVEKDGQLVIEPGVEIRFSPMVGITVRGVITAKGEPDAEISLTSSETSLGLPESRSIRLVDGPSPLEGRVQLFHKGLWRSVCTNSRNWTRADYEIACRQLGFQGGKWSSWFDRQWPENPRLLYEEPQCRGIESSLQDCKNWSFRQLGAGVCDYHPDLAIVCLPFHDGSSKAKKHWRGIKFENAPYDNPLTQDNTFYIRQSKSILRHINIKYAGTGRENNVTSALHVEGVPPRMQWVSILYSSFTGINITLPEAPIAITNCTIRNNRGYGIYVNSSTGLTHIENCVVMDNGADGIKYVNHDEKPDDRLDRTDIYDLCTLPVGSSQTFPIIVSMEQNIYGLNSKECRQRILTLPGHVLTLQFLQMKTDRNDSATIEVYDGTSINDKLLARVYIRNGTLPQSITTTRHNLYLKFNAQPRTQMISFVKLSAGYHKLYDLNITSSAIANNNGRGIAAEKLRSLLHVHDTSVSNNNHIAGIHVLYGVPDINITNSRISYNYADGINITVTGGNRNISKTTISSNKGYGIAVWLNDSLSTEYLHFNQTTIVEYSEIFRNKDIGVFVGNSTGISYVNISGNCFNSSSETAVQVESSWKYNNGIMNLQIGHNVFIENFKLCIKLTPALNIKGKIEYNQFNYNTYGGLLIRNPLYEEFNILPSNILIQHNYFDDNRGVFVVSIGLSPYSDVQKIIFTRNYLRNNIIKEPFDQQQITQLIPRSRVAAVLVVSSANVDIYRNILNNLYSKYEIGSHLEDQSKIINCTYNWLSDIDEEKIQERIFDRKDRYNLAKIEYLPYLLHNTNPATSTIISHSSFIPKFVNPNTNFVGGEVDGLEMLSAGEYIVERDINVRPGGKLVLKPGVTLKFPPAVGMMIAGKLEARGKGLNNIIMTLKEEINILQFEEINETISNENDNNNNNNDYDDATTMTDESITMMTLPPDDLTGVPVRLLGGKTNHEGRLQVRIEGKWGTVCNYGWTIRDAALVCHQLGLILDPDDWNLERSNIPDAGTNQDIIITNVKCTEYDIDISNCKFENWDNFEYSCTHDNDVGVKCLEAGWAGVRLSPLADRSDLQFITIERAGLLDYTTNSLKPALQIDFSRHSLEGIKISNSLQDGLGVIYSDIFSADAVNTIKNSYFLDNKGSGISFKQLGFKILNCFIENNKISGIRHNPSISAVKQREFSGWFMQSFDSTTNIDNPYQPIIIPKTIDNIDIVTGEIKYIVTGKKIGENVRHFIQIRCTPGYVIGIQLLNPIENLSTEKIIIHDSPRIISTTTKNNINNNNNVWDVTKDLSIFPVSSSSFTVILEYISGLNALGGGVLVLTTLPAPIQDIRNRIVKGPIPTLLISKTKIKNNKRGLMASYYNRYIDELGDHYLRKSNETIRFINCELSHNQEEAIYINSPYWNYLSSNISEITIHINNTLITDNGRGIVQFSRDMRYSNNLFHWIMKDNTIERNKNGGLDISLPYVWQYNENFTHSLYFINNTWQNNNMFSFLIDGHYATLNITRNIFDNNNCKYGLISIRGMEKKMKIDHNRIENNNCNYMVEFKIDSQSEILGEIPANFYYNSIKYNNNNNNNKKNLPSYVVGFDGIQKVKINRNLFGDNNIDYELLAGIKTAKINNKIDVSENWWGTTNDTKIKSMIFDFDDWNNHAIADFKPYLTSDSFDSSISISWEIKKPINLDNLGGRITDNIELYARPEPYIINSDITIMPQAVFNIYPGVTMEFAPNVGILVLGTLNAVGVKEHEIIMRPIKKQNNESKDIVNINPITTTTIRLCKDRICSSSSNQGFIEFFNSTTLQWIPLCDIKFTERNGQVACHQLGYDPINTYVNHYRRYEFHPGSLTRIWSWPEPIQCIGNEKNLEECKLRLNDDKLFGNKYNCPWDGKFVFIHCGKRNLDIKYDNYWGGIRIANSEFENYLYEHRFHDIETHETVRRVESILKYINITGAGILHNEKSPAIQAIMKSPIISHVTIEQSAYHGINIISPSHNIELLFNIVNDSLGNGINIASLTGEGREAEESSFTPLKNLNIPYNLFSMIDICDTMKEIEIEERVIIYYKYDNNPVNCVKIFKSSFRAKPFGFRLLQFNIFNSTDDDNNKNNLDTITLYDGDIYNITARKIIDLEFNSKNENKLFTTQGPSLSIKLFANGASGIYGFIAEILTLPISAIGFNRDVQHNISYSVLSNCIYGAIKYTSAGEVNAIMTIERNQIINNCQKYYGNFTTCDAAITIDIQNTQSLYFRNNLIRNNKAGGLFIRSDSRGSATSLKGWINNNLFAENLNKPALYVEGRKSSPYQEITIYRNYFIKNYAQYDNNILLKQVVSNMSYNYLHANLGLHLLVISGFERVRLPIYQSTTHNGFYKNYAIDRNGRSTVIAGTPGQQYVDNVFFNPDNDYEMQTINRSTHLEMMRSYIDAKFNWWGYNESIAVAGRIRDRSDSPELLVVKYNPYHTSNKSVLSGKCPPGWDLVGDTCYIYIGAPMDFYSAREFCRIANASMPFIMGDYLKLWKFLRRQQERFEYSDRVWIQQLERVDQCTTFTYQTIEIDHCSQPSPFICEIDPKVYIDPLSWRKDIVAISVLGAMGAAIALLAFAIGFWISKSKKRKIERLERRNSIRQSLHSLRSVGSTSGFTELAYRRKPISTKSTDTLTSRSLDYKKMLNTGGSIDSMDKSQLNSSIEDNHSYDVYEAHNPRYSPSTSDFKDISINKYQNIQSPPLPPPPLPSSSSMHIDNNNSVFDLAYRNDGFRNHSTFTSRTNSNWPSINNCQIISHNNNNNNNNDTNEDDIPITPLSHHQSDYMNTSNINNNNTSTLPLNSSLTTSDSISELKRDIESTPVYNSPNEFQRYNQQPLEYINNDDSPTTPISEPVPVYFSPVTPPQTYYYDQRPKSSTLLETNLDSGDEKPLRSKSEALLETNFDHFLPSNEPTELCQLSAESRSKSQPLETAM
ncbi:protein bark beetle isoform X2 [Microplitis mediator]|uniref:protein bark beetle isoform X2 n=1 Tax=Microplitis mediator TaxID=375433 RepID=UPI002552C4A3|nr:protein bark beetle isoform X2 [Microplitis mediator]